MPPVPVSYRFTSPTAARQVLETAAQRFSCHRQQSSTRSTTYYDTFDWRVFRAGAMLYAQANGRRKILHWVRPDGTVRHRAAITEKPGFVWDLPTGSLRARLEPILEMRRLLPILSVEARVEAFAILDEREKTVARIRLEEPMVHPIRGGAPSSGLPVVLQAQPVRGYLRQFEAFVKVLEESRPDRLEENEYARATAAAGLRPEAYSRKLDLGLDPGMRSDRAVKTIHRHLLQVVRQNEQGVQSAIDTEFLHDFRVAVRRTRSALSQIKGVYPPPVVAHFKREFSWLGQITGPTRDLDVYRLTMPQYRASLPAPVQGDLDPLQEFLERHWRIEHDQLVRHLDSDRYQALLGDWQEFLDESVPARTELSQAKKPILEVAAREISRSFERVLKRGARIAPETPAGALHRLRVECKKLRYLLEFFFALYDAEKIAPPIKELKRLQDNLGSFNDLEVQQETLRQFAHTMLAEGLATAATLMAMGRLVAGLEARQQHEREKFHKRFQRFSGRRNRQRFRELLAATVTVGA